jgi:hypothetical protein
MAVLAPEDRLLVLRNTIGPNAVSWVEELDPESLEERGRSPDLALGPFWPGGCAVLADGAVVVVQGRWAHRLRPDLSLERSRQLPVDAPHNSFVVLGDGSLATKDLQRPDGTPSVLSVLDPITLQDRGAPLTLPEPSVARLSADGDEIVVVGISTVHRLAWDPVSGALSADPGPSRRYLREPDGSFGWDPVLDAGAIWWMDNGDHRFEHGLTMLGNGAAPSALALWRLRPGEPEPISVEISGVAAGAITNPPLVDPIRGLVVGYDSANGVMAAFDTEDLSLRWRVPLATSAHLILFPDTGEVLANDHDPAAGDSLVVVDVETGEVRARCAVESPAQSVVFPAPGARRDAHFVSLSTVARVTFDD